MDITIKEHFDNPRLFWDLGMGSNDCSMFDSMIQTVVAENETMAKNLFMYYEILFPSNMVRFPRYVYHRLAGNHGPISQRKNELEFLARCGINRKEACFVQDPSDSFLSLPTTFNREVMQNHQENINSLVNSIEACIQRRNESRVSGKIPKYTLSRGRVVHDELILILQILRAKIICYAGE